ncbi:MAG TPA: phage integrase N-terminal domain-containing protein [Gemmatimonadales bacterium]|nr:phage integrase N-terminal domain-containing protein [Gemmatimonadales bacterium]
MRDLNYQLKQLCRRNRDGSYATQADRERMLSLFANQLHEMGFRHMRADSLKPKHVEALVERWKAEGISTGTFKNRLSVLRWWAEKIGKPNVVARDNDAYGIERRQYVTNRDKGKDLDQGQLDRVRSPYVAMSLRLQEAFGLRREEAIKIRPAWADEGNALRLRQSWTKGGRERVLPIRTEEQRAVLNEAKTLAAGASLIPSVSNYKQQLNAYKAECQRAGLNGNHGLRHRYAQTRYFEKAGWQCPSRGGPTKKQLTPEQRSIDERVRLEISLELGHGRGQVTSNYLGR